MSALGDFDLRNVCERCCARMQFDEGSARVADDAGGVVSAGDYADRTGERVVWMVV